MRVCLMNLFLVQAAVLANCGAVLEGDALALHPAPLAEALVERFEERRRFAQPSPKSPTRGVLAD